MDKGINFVLEKLDNRINLFKRDLEKLNKLSEDSDLNPMAIQDVAFVIDISMNALLQFKKELQSDIDDKEVHPENQ